MLSTTFLLVASMVVGQAEKPLSPGQQKMEELSFLIGTWQNVDKEDDTRVYSWINNKSYIMFVAGQYREIIGWDLQHERIVSWCFGTDGGQGRSLWVKEGDNWRYTGRGFLDRWGKPMRVYSMTIDLPDSDTLKFTGVATDADGKPDYLATYKRVKTDDPDCSSGDGEGPDGR